MKVYIRKDEHAEGHDCGEMTPSEAKTFIDSLNNLPFVETFNPREYNMVIYDPGEVEFYFQYVYTNNDFIFEIVWSTPFIDE